MKSDIKSSSHLFEEQKKRAKVLCIANEDFLKFTLHYIKMLASVKHTIVTRFLLFALGKESKELKSFKWRVQSHNKFNSLLNHNNEPYVKKPNFKPMKYI